MARLAFSSKIKFRPGMTWRPHRVYISFPIQYADISILKSEFPDIASDTCLLWGIFVVPPRTVLVIVFILQICLRSDWFVLLCSPLIFLHRCCLIDKYIFCKISDIPDFEVVLNSFDFLKTTSKTRKWEQTECKMDLHSRKDHKLLLWYLKSLSNQL